MIREKYKKGFTLIELIVVIGIIALLSSIIMTSMSGAKIKAKNTGAISQIREYQTAIGLYLLENGNKYPNVGDTAVHCIGSGNNKCLWAGTEFSTESSGSLVILEKHIRGLPFVDTGTLSSNTGEFKGLLYRCNDASCKTASFYWPEIGVTTCNKGSSYYVGFNGLICTELAEGSKKGE